MKISDYLSVKSLFKKGIENQNRNLIVLSVALFVVKKLRNYKSGEIKSYKLRPGDTIEIFQSKSRLK